MPFLREEVIENEKKDTEKQLGKMPERKGKEREEVKGKRLDSIWLISSTGWSMKDRVEIQKT